VLPRIVSDYFRASSASEITRTRTRISIRTVRGRFVRLDARVPDRSQNEHV
jgi:hypothetical protein